MTATSVIAMKCACGAGYLVPAPDGPARAHCPKCGVEAAVNAPVDVAGDQSCPICQTTVEPGQQWAACGACGLVHHHECWTEMGGCGAYGCTNAPAKAATDADSAPRTAWGDTKPCPICGETIKSIAIKCRYCGTELGTVDPLSAGDFFETKRSRQSEQSLRAGVSVLFAISLIGLFAPIMLIITLAVVLPQRAKIRNCGPLFITLGFASIGISAFYTLLMLIFWLASAR